MQPPARAPNFMDRWHSDIWPIIGTDNSYISCGMLDDLYAAKGKPRIVCPETPGDAAYRVWKKTVDDMWVGDTPLDMYHAFIEQRATIELAAAHCQHLLEERAAQDREMATTRSILLWFCRRRLHARLAQLTSRRQQREVALTCFQYEQECITRVQQAEELRKQAAAMHAKALADTFKYQQHDGPTARG
jgi:hypothetical protein